jgi:hypothetical protein
MEYILKSLGLTDLRSSYEWKQLIATADRIRPGRADNVASKTRNFRNWHELGSEFIIDRVYGIDYITEMKGSNQRVAFDFTTNPEEVKSKIDKMKEFTPLWKSMGIDKVVVLLTVYPEGEDTGLLFIEKDSAQEDILGIYYNTIETDEEVTFAEIHIKNKN